MTHPNPKDPQADIREAIILALSQPMSKRVSAVESLFQAHQQEAYKKGYIDGSTASVKAMEDET